MIYAYGKNRKELKLEYVGKGQLNNTPCFKLRFANNYLLCVRAKNFQLQVTDSSGKYNKTFSWEYEGPVNGIGTFCDVCSADEKEAMDLIRSFYLE